MSLLDHLPGAAVAFDVKADRRRDRFLALALDALKRLGRAADPLVSADDWSAGLDARSRIDLTLPRGSELTCRVGDRTVAGVTVIGRLPGTGAS